MSLKSPPTPAWRWSVLVALSVAMFGDYYAVGPVADSLQRILGFTDTQIGTLNAIYSLPNIANFICCGLHARGSGSV